jgi:glutathione-specific gamma-glutamylcyclotransferase
MRNLRRTMRLTAEHVAWLRRDIADPGPQVIPGHRPATEADYADSVAQMLATRPAGPFWLFAYGSLIWKPETAFVELRTAVARGWHRRFCLGWDERFRGNPAQPAVMMALDRGGTCKGVVYRLPEDGLAAELHRLIRREQSQVPASFPWRWIELMTEAGPLKAMTFAMDRNSPRYVSGLSEEQLVEVLATACGFRGSMVEYLFSTVSKLEEMGIHDRTLWRLQERLAERIDAIQALQTGNGPARDR